MNTRGTESPMDFEWQGYGPVDTTSPFHRHVMENQKKRTHSAFDSPQRTTIPALRAPNSQPYLFSKPLPQPPTPQYRAPSFITPRKPSDFDFSSGPENSSPADQADNEDTPDGKPSVNESGASEYKTPSKRNSLFPFYGKYAPSPGRGELPKKTYSNGVVKRLHKKRRKAENFEKQLALGRRSSEESSGEDNGQVPKYPSQPPQEIGWMTGFFTFIHTYPDAPSIIAKYLQVFFNAAILAGCLYMFYSFYATIQSDVNRASEDAMAEVLAEMAACSKNYVENRCGADNRLPALETVCSNWELCMNRDPGAVKRARLSAHTFAEIFNSFVEPISLKTMIFTSTLVVLGLLVNNATFTLFRRSQQHHYTDAYRHPSESYMHPAEQGGALRQYSATPSVPYGQPPHLQWHRGHDGYPEQQRLEYPRSPSKEHRARSRSPEKKLMAR